MNRIGGVLMLVAAAGLSGCVGYGLPGSGDYSQGGSAYPGNGYGYPSDGDYNGGYAGGVVRCESSDERTRYCDIDTRRGVRLTRQISDTRCIQGRNWGYDNRGVWVSQGCRAEFVSGGGNAPGGGYGNVPGGGYDSGTVRCESTDNRTRRCDIDTRRGVRLTRQLSGTPCMQGRNWGFDNRGVWVSQGCRAEFVSGGGSGGPGYGGNNGGQDQGQILRCESNDNRQRRCNVSVRRSVDLLRQLSGTRCVRGQNWGWDRGGVWVNGGCRGEFRVN